MKKYIIKAGKHYCRKGIVDLFKAIVPIRKRYNSIEIDVKFNSSCLIKSATPLQWNKLGGISQAGSRHKNSMRIAWRAEGDKIRIAVYSYKDGKRIINFFLNLLDIDTMYNISIWDSALTTQTFIQVKSITLETTDEVDFGYLKERYHEMKHFSDLQLSSIKNPTISYPYYGGESTVDKDVMLEFSIKAYGL